MDTKSCRADTYDWRRKELSRAKEADKQFEKGYSCAPSVLPAYSEQFGLEKELALKIACGFGGGIGRTGRTCGAVTGAVIVIGLKHGQAYVNERFMRVARHTSYRATFRKSSGPLLGVCQRRNLNVDV